MVQKLDHRRETPSQTAGPYVHIGCTPTHAGIDGVFQELGTDPFPGEAGRITITGRVIDGFETAIADPMIETWQAGPDGTYGPGTRGWARVVVDPETGIWTLNTVKPGATGDQAPHIALWIVARGINLGLQTRIYFPEDDQSRDPVLCRVEHPHRAQTLIAKATGAGAYAFDIVLQGETETLFLDI
ncbi:MAG: protocatechuate 3,4-dioxygenase subunit alpha [Pseudomonadota bacterium]